MKEGSAGRRWAPPRAELCHKYPALLCSCLRCPSLTDASGAVRAVNMFIWFTVVAGLAILSLSFLKTLFPYLSEDCTYILRSIKLGIRLVKYKKIKPFYSLLDCFLDAARRHPSKTFVKFEGRDYSYGEVDKQSSRTARALQAAAALKEGDPVALFLANEPSFIWTWLALAKLGCPAALLNFNIRSKSLLHCFSCCGAKVIIASAGNPPYSPTNARVCRFQGPKSPLRLTDNDELQPSNSFILLYSPNLLPFFQCVLHLFLLHNIPFGRCSNFSNEDFLFF